MNESLQAQASKWIADRNRIIESRTRLGEEYGIWVSEKRTSICPDHLEEPLQSEVIRQLRDTGDWD